MLLSVSSLCQLEVVCFRIRTSIIAAVRASRDARYDGTANEPVKSRSSPEMIGLVNEPAIPIVFETPKAVPKVFASTI